MLGCLSVGIFFLADCFIFIYPNLLNTLTAANTQRRIISTVSISVEWDEIIRFGAYTFFSSTTKTASKSRFQTLWCGFNFDVKTLCILQSAKILLCCIRFRRVFNHSAVDKDIVVI